MNEASFATGAQALQHYGELWQLTPDGVPFRTHSSWLQRVIYNGAPAMLKIAVESEEKRGAGLMIWWGGEGAARVLAHEGDALLLERAQGKASLDEMARNGRDDEVSRIICSVVAKLHVPRPQSLPELIPLSVWFRELAPAATKFGGILVQAAATAHELLASPQDVTVLHGDIHHGNILDFGPRGWLAIDPKRLLGERGFDFANTFCNPDLKVAACPGRLARQATLVAESAHLDRERLLKWILAYSGLSAAWTLNDCDDATLALTVAELAAAELKKI